MAGITLDQAQAQLNLYLAAEATVLTGQSYTIAGRSLTRANLGDIQAGIKLWDGRVKQLGLRVSGRSRSRTVVVGG